VDSISSTTKKMAPNCGVNMGAKQKVLKSCVVDIMRKIVNKHIAYLRSPTVYKTCTRDGAGALWI